MLLTPEFGPLQRVAFLFTDAELEYDDMYNGKPLCRKCGACVRECPGGCMENRFERLFRTREPWKSSIDDFKTDKNN